MEMGKRVVLTKTLRLRLRVEVKMRVEMNMNATHSKCSLATAACTRTSKAISVVIPVAAISSAIFTDVEEGVGRETHLKLVCQMWVYEM